MSRAPRMRVFEPFGNRRFSLYFSGQVISNTGTWFQNLALSLVVLEATGSAQALSGVTVAQFLPLLVLSLPAGRLADRVRPRTILLVTSLASALVVAGLAFVTLAPEPPIGAIYALVAALGSVHAFERVAAQAIIFEIVGPEALARSVSLSTIALASARSIGPGLAGIAFQGLGATACMLINSASFLLVFASIAAIRPARLFPRPQRAERPGRGIRSSFFSRELVTLLIVNALVALLALNLMLVLTATVSLTFAGDATAVGATHTLNALGAIVGRRPRRRPRSRHGALAHRRVRGTRSGTADERRCAHAGHPARARAAARPRRRVLPRHPPRGGPGQRRSRPDRPDDVARDARRLRHGPVRRPAHGMGDRRSGRESGAGDRRSHRFRVRGLRRRAGCGGDDGCRRPWPPLRTEPVPIPCWGVGGWRPPRPRHPHLRSSRPPECRRRDPAPRQGSARGRGR